MVPRVVNEASRDHSPAPSPAAVCCFSLGLLVSSLRRQMLESRPGPLCSSQESRRPCRCFGLLFSVLLSSCTTAPLGCPPHLQTRPSQTLDNTRPDAAVLIRGTRLAGGVGRSVVLFAFFFLLPCSTKCVLLCVVYPVIYLDTLPWSTGRGVFVE
jgi:hypothetical protein